MVCQLTHKIGIFSVLGVVESLDCPSNLTILGVNNFEPRPRLCLLRASPELSKAHDKAQRSGQSVVNSRGLEAEREGFVQSWDMEISWTGHFL